MDKILGHCISKCSVCGVLIHHCECCLPIGIDWEICEECEDHDEEEQTNAEQEITDALLRAKVTIEKGK